MADTKELTPKNTEKPKRRNPKQSELLAPQLKKGEMSRYLRHCMWSWDLPPIDISDEKQVKQRIEEYFMHCIQDDMKPTVVGCSAALGIDRHTFNDWCKGNTRAATHTATVKKAKEILENMMENYMLNGKINPVSGIFLLKNNFGYQDKQEVVLTPNNPLGDYQTQEELAKRYAQGVGEYDELPEGGGDV